MILKNCILQNNIVQSNDMQQPILSICIPTYNRAKKLKECLESVRIQLANSTDLNEMVEVVISNNASTDETESIIEHYKPLFKNYRYTKNQHNIGLDKNVINVVKSAHGTYCWYLGDDDTIIDGGIRHILSLLQTNKYDVLTVEAEPVTKHTTPSKAKKFREDSIIEVIDPNEFYFRGFCQGGFSVLVFNRELWLKCLNEEKYLPHWVYFETVLHMLIKTKKHMVNVHEFVVVTGQDCRWSENGTEIYTFINSNLLLERMIEFGFDKERITTDLRKNKKQIFIILLRAKGHGLTINKENLTYIYTKSHVGPLYLLPITLIYFIPNSIIVAIRTIKKKISR